MNLVFFASSVVWDRSPHESSLKETELYKLEKVEIQEVITVTAISFLYPVYIKLIVSPKQALSIDTGIWGSSTKLLW